MTLLITPGLSSSAAAWGVLNVRGQQAIGNGFWHTMRRTAVDFSKSAIKTISYVFIYPPYGG
jgi:hypothetical protein